MGIEV